jgi:hypothetical protein
MAGAVHLYGVIADEQMGGVRRDVARPADHAEAIVAAEKEIVGDIEVARSGVFGPNAKPDVFEAAILDGESGGSENLFFSCKYGDVSVAESEAVEDVVRRGHDLKQDVIACAVENNVTVAGGFMVMGLSGAPFSDSVKVPSNGAARGST